MRFAEADTDGSVLIARYGAEGIELGGRRYVRGLMVTPETVLDGWGPGRPEALEAGHLEPLIACAPQVVVIGTGAVQVFPDPALYASVLEHGIGIEIMDTGAACRTYNILVSEGRRVAAGLMPCR